MNYFAHGLRLIDDPYFLAGAAIPDWLNVADRRVRVRSKHAAPFCDDTDPRMARLAAGITQHHADDRWFHETTAFAELSWRFTVMIRDALEPDDGLRPSFLGHILVELLLDATLIAEAPEQLEAYYQAIAAVDPHWVEWAVNCMAPRPAERLSWFITAFLRERFLWDYAEDGKLCYRLNQVMRRVKLPELGDAFKELLPEARAQVASRRTELLTQPNTQPA